MCEKRVFCRNSAVNRIKIISGYSPEHVNIKRARAFVEIIKVVSAEIERRVTYSTNFNANKLVACTSQCSEVCNVIDDTCT